MAFRRVRVSREEETKKHGMCGTEFDDYEKKGYETNIDDSDIEEEEEEERKRFRDHKRGRGVIGNHIGANIDEIDGGVDYDDGDDGGGGEDDHHHHDEEPYDEEEEEESHSAYEKGKEVSKRERGIPPSMDGTLKAATFRLYVNLSASPKDIVDNPERAVWHLKHHFKTMGLDFSVGDSDKLRLGGISVVEEYNDSKFSIGYSTSWGRHNDAFKLPGMCVPNVPVELQKNAVTVMLPKTKKSEVDGVVLHGVREMPEELPKSFLSTFEGYNIENLENRGVSSHPSDANLVNAVRSHPIVVWLQVYAEKKAKAANLDPENIRTGIRVHDGQAVLSKKAFSAAAEYIRRHETQSISMKEFLENFSVTFWRASGSPQSSGSENERSIFNGRKPVSKSSNEQIIKAWKSFSDVKKKITKASFKGEQEAAKVAQEIMETELNFSLTFDISYLVLPGYNSNRNK